MVLNTLPRFVYCSLAYCICCTENFHFHWPCFGKLFCFSELSVWFKKTSEVDSPTSNFVILRSICMYLLCFYGTLQINTTVVLLYFTPHHQLTPLLRLHNLITPSPVSNLITRLVPDSFISFPTLSRACKYSFDPKCPARKRTLPNVLRDREKRYRAAGVPTSPLLKNKKELVPLESIYEYWCFFLLWSNSNCFFGMWSPRKRRDSENAFFTAPVSRRI
jgi:hypothetical protein